MNIAADLHCHTSASTHAFSSLNEMVGAAKKKGLSAIAITDHGIGMPDSPHIWHFGAMLDLPKMMDGLVFIPGVEANIMNYNGTIDMPLQYLNRIPWVIVSFHDAILTSGTVKDHTRAWLEVAKNPYVDVIGHSGQEKFSFDYELVLPEFKKNGKIVEINNRSSSVRPDSRKNCKKIIGLCKEYEVPVVINSDAHSTFDVGEISGAVSLLKEVDFPKELVVNLSMERLAEFIYNKKRYSIY